MVHRELSDAPPAIRFRIAGWSMAPALSDGDEVVVRPGAQRHVTVGDLVLAKHPYQRDVHIVKRVARITDDGRYYLLGDNPHESTDSRAFGALRPERILGKVIL